MRNTLFVMTHRGAPWRVLKNTLEQNPKIHVFTTGISYKHHEDLQELWEHNHRNENSAAWWVDIITQNEKFTCRELAKHCKFLYFVADPNHCLDRIWVEDPNLMKRPMNKAAYYRFRLRGLAQWWMRTGGPWIDCEREFIDPDLLQEGIERFVPELAFDYESNRKSEQETPQFDFNDGFPPTLKKECRDAFLRYTRIIQGTPEPTDGDSHLLSMRAEGRSP